MKDDALYLEADEDITSAIDKLHKSGGSSVQIVVPKRSTMLQSIINLKLLKKAAAGDGKELVLVTNDRIASDLAGRVGLAVAPSLGAKAVVAAVTVPEELKNTEEVIEADDPPPPPPAAEPAPKKNASKRPPLLKRRDVSDGPPAPPTLPEAAEGAAAAAEGAKKAPKVPNFGRLQRRLLWVGLAVFLVIAYFAGMYLLSSAKVTLFANGTKVDIDTTFAVDPAAKQSDNAGGVLAGQLVTSSKDLSGPFTPSGKQDAGSKASGTITVTNSFDSNPHLLTSGTRFVAPDGKLFRSTADATVPGAGVSGGHVSPGTAQVAVTADQNGDSYNEGPAKYTIPGLSADQQAGIYGQGAQMSGGITKTVSVVVQPDVDNEQAALLAKDQPNSARDLQSHLPAGYVALAGSQTNAVSGISPSPAVGAQGDTGTLQIHVTYTEMAVKKSDYEALIQAQEQKQVGSGSQIYDDGLSGAQVTPGNKDSQGRQTFHFTTEAFSGNKLDTASIANQLKGQKYGDATNLAAGLPGVTQATISITPGWSSSLPSRADKIKIVIQVAKQ